MSMMLELMGGIRMGIGGLIRCDKRDRRGARTNNPEAGERVAHKQSGNNMGRRAKTTRAGQAMLSEAWATHSF